MTHRSIVRPVEPVDADGDPLPGWTRLGMLPMEFDVAVWDHEFGVRVLTAVEVVEEAEHREASGPHYHVSMTRWNTRTGAGPYRIDSVDAAYVLREFFGGLEGWEEDNHVPGGQARNFWRPVADPRVGIECFCKKHEPKIVEDGGDYVWRPL